MMFLLFPFPSPSALFLTIWKNRVAKILDKYFEINKMIAEISNSHENSLLKLPLHIKVSMKISDTSRFLKLYSTLVISCDTLDLLLIYWNQGRFQWNITHWFAIILQTISMFWQTKMINIALQQIWAFL